MAASRAAPVRSMGPETTSACPRVYLWSLAPGRRSADIQSVGPFSHALNGISSSTLSGMPI